MLSRLAHPIALASLLFLFTQTLFAALPPSLKRVRVLIAADVHTYGGIGAGVLQDAKNMKAFIEEIFFNPDLPQFQGRATLDFLGIDEKLSRKQILDYYKNLNVDPQDVLLFYYSGHGGFDGRYEESFLGLANGDHLSRLELKEQMIQVSLSGYRILITDMCSSFADYSPPLPATGFDKGSNVFREMIETLFFKQRGTLDFTAASAGESGIGPTSGGFFTNGLLEAFRTASFILDKDGNGTVTWNEIISQTQSNTNGKYQNFRTELLAQKDDGKLRAQKKQMPLAFAIPCTHTGSVNHIRVFHSQRANNRDGMSIEVAWEMHGYRDRPVIVTVYLVDDKGKYLMDSDGNYRSKSGRIAAWRVITPGYQDAVAKTSIFFPYDELDMSEEQLQSYPFLQVYSELQDGQNNEVIGHSVNVPFQTK